MATFTALERCRERATIIEPLAKQFYGMRDFTIRSPDGHVLCFGEPSQP
ncbi:MAG: hypothetical protein ACKVT1_20410 [Dehalococcoidia bacterium]